MTNTNELHTIMTSVLGQVPDPELRAAGLGALEGEADALAEIDAFFRDLPTRPRSREWLACWFHSWRATHLKMLAIYGLSCRMQRLAKEHEGAAARGLLEAATLNAETSHEDLGLDYDGVTHADLYDQFAAAFLDDDAWKLERHGLSEAREFGRWVYRNMVVEPVEVGLLTNLFSEVYNHAEYTVAQRAFSELIDAHHAFTPERRRAALTYIEAHVEHDTEVEHFQSVLDALHHYTEASGGRVDEARACSLFRAYLRKLASVMARLRDRMQVAA